MFLKARKETMISAREALWGVAVSVSAVGGEFVPQSSVSPMPGRHIGAATAASSARRGPEPGPRRARAITCLPLSLTLACGPCSSWRPCLNTHYRKEKGKLAGGGKAGFSPTATTQDTTTCVVHWHKAELRKEGEPGSGRPLSCRFSEGSRRLAPHLDAVGASASLSLSCPAGPGFSVS